MYKINLMPKYKFDNDRCIECNLVRSMLTGYLLTLAISIFLGMFYSINYIFYFWMLSASVNCLFCILVNSASRIRLSNVIKSCLIGPVVTIAIIYCIIILMFEYHIKGPHISKFFKKTPWLLFKYMFIIGKYTLIKERSKNMYDE
jgi:hypothetical protein